MAEEKDQNLNLLFKCVAGSKAYGLEVPGSDIDIRGVFYLPKEQFYGLNHVPQISEDKNDVVFYELGRFVELLLKNNPNMLELLAMPEDCILYRHPIMDKLKPEMFLSKLCKNTFAGYAVSQIKKARGLNKKILNPMPKERKNILDFCYVHNEVGGSMPLIRFLDRYGWVHENCGLAAIPHMKDIYDLYYLPQSESFSSDSSDFRGIITDDNSTDVILTSIPKDIHPVNRLHFNKDGFSLYCKEYKEYWEWVENRNEIRFNNTMSHGKQYDAKNMMHTIRLLQMSEEILSTGKLTVRVPNRDELLSIRNGELEYEDLVNRATEMIERVEKLYETSTLPETPDKDAVERVLVEMREELYGK